MRWLRKGRSLMVPLISPMSSILSMTESGPIKEAEKSNKEHEPYHVARKTETDVTSDPSTINLSDGSNNPDGVLKQRKEKRKAKHEKVMQAKYEELLKRISEQRKELVESLLESDAPFSLEDMTLFLGILRDEPDLDPEAVQQVGEIIHAYLGSLGIHGDDAKSSLEILMERISKYRSAVRGLIYRPREKRSHEERVFANETFELLEKFPESHAKPRREDSTVELSSD
ncbi:merozoite surface protein 37/41 [Babesia divergens]|uniref:Merozoite surface protein 37/41 n=1 Tax=Babesia divergens TaxID=32595 RepID=A0AAD9LL23_BABDI|nr:merozoite surface protein 37/41 [Babesia divergens]